MFVDPTFRARVSGRYRVLDNLLNASGLAMNKFWRLIWKKFGTRMLAARAGLPVALFG